MPDTTPLQKVLIANRGEIAVRVIRACKDAGIGSVAVYADPDRDALFVRLADEAHSLDGATPAESYLSIEKIIKIAVGTGADSVHPGYGFLAENSAFAQAVLDAGLIWIGPPPAAIDALGDKVQARHIAQKVGAPLVAGTPDPVESADEVVTFAKEHGLGEAGVLGEEAVARVHGVGAGVDSDLEDLGDVEVGLGGCRPAEGVRLVGQGDEQGVGVRVGVHGDAREFGIGRGPDHADGDLTPVGDQHLADAHAILSFDGLSSL